MSSNGASKELQSLRRLWLALATLALVVSIEVWNATQGADGVVSIGLDAVFGLNFAKGIPEAIAALLGVALLSLIAIFNAFVLGSHARKASGAWASRFPFRFFDLPPNYGIGTGVQVAAIVMLSLLPLYMLGHSYRVMLQHGVLCSEEATGWALAPDSSDLWRARDGEAVKFSSSEEPGSCEIMVDYLPPLQTWAFAAMTIVGIVAGLISLATLWMPAAIQTRRLKN